MDRPRPVIDDTLLERARALLDADPALRLGALGGQLGVEPHALRRRFLARFGLTPAQYGAQRRLNDLRAALRSGQDATTAVYAAGYGSPSRVYADGAARLGMTPQAYRSGGQGVEILYTTLDTALGPTLVATTLRGVCAVWPGVDEARAAGALAEAFPRARLQRVDDGAQAWVAPRVQGVARALAGDAGQAVPLELVGTAFQHHVWDALMRIPAGTTLSYSELAASLGRPRAVRAVASACAANRVAVLVPCHRVLRGDGSLGGYRWGLPCKRQLLARERGEAGRAVSDRA